MAAIKSFTSLEQSRKLAEILPLESADMFYDGVQDLYNEKVYNIPINGSSITVRTGHIITKKGIKANLLLPCWSLTALLGALPLVDFTTPQLIGTSKTLYRCMYNEDLKSHAYDNPIDACVEIILKLNELNLL